MIKDGERRGISHSSTLINAYYLRERVKKQKRGQNLSVRLESLGTSGQTLGILAEKMLKSVSNQTFLLFEQEKVL